MKEKSDNTSFGALWNAWFHLLHSSENDFPTSGLNPRFLFRFYCARLDTAYRINDKYFDCLLNHLMILRFRPECRSPAIRSSIQTNTSKTFFMLASFEALFWLKNASRGYFWHKFT